MQKILIILSLLPLSINATAQETQKYAQAPDGGEAHIYKTVGKVKLPLYVFNPKNHKNKEKIPAAVFFHGGRWNGGSPAKFEPHCKYLAERGMVAMPNQITSRSAQNLMRWF